MKKIFVSATLGLVLVSCGGPSVCDCVKMEQELMKETIEAQGEEAIKAVEEKYAEQTAECAKLSDGKSGLEMGIEASECL